MNAAALPHNLQSQESYPYIQEEQFNRLIHWQISCVPLLRYQNFYSSNLRIMREKKFLWPFNLSVSRKPQFSEDPRERKGFNTIQEIPFSHLSIPWHAGLRWSILTLQHCVNMLHISPVCMGPTATKVHNICKK